MASPSMVKSNRTSVVHSTFGASASNGGMEDTPVRLRSEFAFNCKPFHAPQPVDLLLFALPALFEALLTHLRNLRARVVGGAAARP
jgi:hypothetical protein